MATTARLLADIIQLDGDIKTDVAATEYVYILDATAHYAASCAIFRTFCLAVFGLAVF